jgi:alkanesulfonate monooxygenase SsuD/methylene tetrahydromethanopterin reductase-like flavin-dependent oxidoreductase (luciferase family)
VVSLDPLAATRASFDAFRRAWMQAWGDAPLPRMGLGRFVVVADTDAAALALARRAYPKWYDGFTYLHRRHGRIGAHPRPPTFDGLAEVGQGVAGSPQTVAAFLSRELADCGSNYCVGQFAFGDLTLTETLHSIDLFAQEVMPRLVGRAAASAVD